MRRAGRGLIAGVGLAIGLGLAGLNVARSQARAADALSEEMAAAASAFVSSLDDAGKINQAYLIALGRPASKADEARALRFLRESGAANESQTWISFCQSLLASAEFRYVQ